MEPHIIFFDLDGTLLNQQKEVPKSAKEAIFKLKEQGHIVAIATGRAPFMFKDLRDELDLDTYVSFNGQFVVLNGEVIFKNPLNPEALKKLTDIAMNNEHPIVYMDHEDMKANVPDHDYIKESISSLKIGHYPSHDPKYIQRELYQSLLFCTSGEEEYYQQNFDEFDFVRWHRVSVDILPKGGSKAKGINEIIRRLNISEENQVAFGDARNDLEMLRQIKHSFAMGNGHPLAKEAAANETASADDDGIYKGLKKLSLI